MHLRGVIERQRMNGAVIGGEVEDQQCRQVLVDQRPMGHHRSLRRRGGAGGVEELSDVRVVDGELPVTGRGDGVRGRHGCQRGQVDDLGLRTGRCGGDGFDEIVIGEDDPCPGVVEDVVELVAL
jgi:hypothetical protein